ncbi:MAG: hypothetical protein MJ106_01775 [Lentisphaeria bacterium]|nr:hypothetical protein [Lentisphaeria bacterium]
MNPKTRQILLVAIMVVVTLLALKQYLPMIQLPTAKRVQEKRNELKSLQGDLKVAKKTYQMQLEEIQAMQGLAEPFWTPLNAAAKVDQEISSEFNRITRMAQLTTAAGSQKVDIGREKNGSCLQEVTLSVDFKNVSMKDLTRFFTQMRANPNGKKFRWEYCKVSPDNPRTPNAVNMSARFKILVLNSDAMNFLGLRNAPALPTNAPTSRKK